MTTVRYRYATVRARRLFYREAGPRGAPDVVLPTAASRSATAVS